MYNPQVKTFIIVADAGSFNKAAEQLFVSSTAIIKQMNLLEDHLEVRLFHRSHKGLSLTEAGKVFYKDAKHIIKYSENTVKRVREAERGVSDIVRIGTSPITPVDYLTSLAPKFQAEHIQFQIIPFENNPENARQILSNLGRDIDVVMGIYDESTDKVYEKINTLTVQELPLSILMSSTDQLASKEQLEWSDLEGRRVYLLNAGWSHAIDELRKDIVAHHPNVEIVDFPFLNTAIFNQCINDGDVFVGLSIWKHIHLFLTVRPMNWNYSMNYGVLYSQEPSEPVKKFLNVVKENI